MIGENNMASRKRYTVRKSVMGNDRVSSSYLMERSEDQGRSISAGYRFGKISRTDAASLRSQKDASKIMQSIKRRENNDGVYEVISL